MLSTYIECFNAIVEITTVLTFMATLNIIFVISHQDKIKNGSDVSLVFITHVTRVLFMLFVF